MTMNPRNAALTGGAIDLAEVKARAEARAQATNTSVDDVPTAFTVTAENLEVQVLLRSGQVPVIVLVGTARSEQSEQLRMDLAQLAGAANHAFVFGYVDADMTPDIAQMFGVTGLPTVIALADGRPLANFQGGAPMEELQQWTAAVVNAVAGKLAGLGEQAEAPEDPRFEPALEALNNGDFDGAIAVYDEILAHEPNNHMAKAARENARFLSRLASRNAEQDAVALADAEPGNLELAKAAADQEIAAGQVESAFNRMVAVIKATSGDARTAARDHLLSLFVLFEAGDPRVIAARAEMANALFS